ncbi:zinc finger BED domain-containing protein 4-like [Leptopilina heterotoma]|uniref:zinc finger BED domain-containing protein 4-like n=1 Tax=Leptopilina heterotoma TaxID=63436 RepID=UPI001CA7E3D7|nr:zinc finger BED domain-containing protein 4-like [Leptopilina heterotoma]
MSGGPSPVRKHFLPTDKKNLMQCKYCSGPHSLVKCSGNTTNMFNHLKANHVEIYNALMIEIDEKKSNLKRKHENKENSSSTNKSTSAQNNESVSSSASESLTTTEPSEQSGRENIKYSFKNISSFQEGGTKHKNLTDKILFMICEDSEPFSMVERKGFIKMMKYAVLNYKVPSRQTFINHLDSKYDTVSQKYKILLKNVTCVTLTTDIWTESKNTRSFLGVTVHFRDKDQFMSGILGVHELTESHTAIYIKEILEKVCAEWEIDKSIITAIVTDNAANMALAVELFLGKNHRLGFCAHTINLVATDSIKKIDGLDNVIKKVKTIVTWFKRSVNATDLLRKKSKLKLIQDVETHWNSTFYMIERFIELRKIVNEILDDFSSAPPAVTAAELEILKELTNVLRPLESATRDLCGQKYVTTSMVIPLINGLQRELENLVLEHQVASVLKENLLKEILRRFGLMESCHFFAIATILDPRFKKVVFKQPTECARAISQINRLFLEIKSNNSTERELDSDGDTNNESEESKEKSSLWKYCTDCVQNAKRGRKELSDSGYADELTLYLRSEVSHFETDPIRFWVEMEHIYPTLSQIALKYLTVVATSVPSERLFSKTGILMNEKRNRLEGSKLHKQLFWEQSTKLFGKLKTVYSA